MRRFFLFALVLLAVVALWHAEHKNKYLPIIFDDWWNVDYVKNGCELAATYAEPCPVTNGAPEDIVREFENELVVAFASEDACHELALLHFTPAMAKEAVKHPAATATGAMAKQAAPHWSLLLDLDGHSQSQAGQGWSIVDPEHHVLTGKITTPQHLVQQICKIAKGVGGDMGQ